MAGRHPEIMALGRTNTTHMGHDRVRTEVYRQAGVNTDEADAGLQGIIRRVQETWRPMSEIGGVMLPIGYFANVINFHGTGLALCTDGVGSKTILASMMGKYDTIGIDCVAMNVNDMICVGAKPLSLVDYLAVGRADAAMIDAIGAGLCEGARLAGISIVGGETAQLGDIVQGFDLVGMAVGRVDLDKVLHGRDVSEGDVVIGVRSNGIHSNGFSIARKAFFQGPTSLPIDHKFDDLDVRLGEELLRPTDIYVAETLEVLAKVPGVKAAINITSDGLLNLTRVSADVGFVIDRLIEPQPIFQLIQAHAKVEDSEMFEVFNMGTGFCYVVAAGSADRTVAILEEHGREAWPIGYATDDADKIVRIPQRKLVGRGKRFRSDEGASKKAG